MPPIYKGGWLYYMLWCLTCILHCNIIVVLKTFKPLDNRIEKTMSYEFHKCRKSYDLGSFHNPNLNLQFLLL